MTKQDKAIKELKRVNHKLRSEMRMLEIRLSDESTKWESKFYEEAKKNDKAIEYIENEMPCLWEVDDVWEDIEGNYQHNYKEYDTQILLNKLKGVDKE